MFVVCCLLLFFFFFFFGGDTTDGNVFSFHECPKMESSGQGGSGGRKSTRDGASGASGGGSVGFSMARGIDVVQFAESRVHEIKGLLATLKGSDRARRVVSDCSESMWV